MANRGMFALTALLAVVAVAPVFAQANTPKPSKQERKAMSKTERQERKAERKAEKRDAMMSNNMSGGRMMTDTMAPSMQNNTAAVQANIDRANKTLSDMVALLDQIEARKKGGATQ